MRHPECICRRHSMSLDYGGCFHRFALDIRFCYIPAKYNFVYAKELDLRYKRMRLANKTGKIALRNEVNPHHFEIIKLLGTLLTFITFFAELTPIIGSLLQPLALSDFGTNFGSRAPIWIRTDA
jgi:hypothetical protein